MPTDRTLTRVELADELDVNPGSVKAWLREGVPHDRGEPGKPNLYDPAEVLAWLKSKNRDGTPGRPSEPTSPELDAARLRKENALADKYELDVTLRRAELLPADEVQRRWAQVVSEARDQMGGLPAAVAAECVGMEAQVIQGILDERIVQILNRLSEAG